MIRINKYLFLAASLLQSVAASSTHDEEDYTVTQLALGETVQDFEIQGAGETAFFELTIADNEELDAFYEDGEDLVIKVIPLDYASDPDVFISFTNERPDSWSNAEIICAAYGRDTCAIPSSSFEEGEIVYIGIKSYTVDTKFNLIPELTKEYILEDGVELQIYLDYQDVRLFKFYVDPIDENDESTVVTIKGSAYRSDSHDFSFDVDFVDDNYEPILPSSGYTSFSSDPAWRQGQVLRFEPWVLRMYCHSGCWMNILMDVIDSGEYHLMAMTRGSVPQLYDGVQFDDVVNWGDRQCYLYNVQNDDTDVQVSLVVYSGYAQMKATPGANIATDEIMELEWEDLEIDIETYMATIMDIRPHRREKLDQMTGVYYICVNSILPSTYTIKVSEYENNQRDASLIDGFTEVFNMQAGDIHKHLYEVPSLDYSGEDIDINFLLVSKQGAMPEIAVKFCEEIDPEDCKEGVTAEIAMAEWSGFTSQVNVNDVGGVLEVAHDETKCSAQREEGLGCYYLVVIINNSDEHERYQLTAYHSQINHIILQEGQAQIDSLSAYAQKYYKFTINQIGSNHINSVTFDLTPIHGDPDILVSRTNQFPNVSDAEYFSLSWGSLEDHIQYTSEADGELSATYYIMVEGYTYSTYSLLVTVDRDIDSLETGVQQTSAELYESLSITKTLHSSDEQFFAWFEANLDEDSTKKIIISLNNLEKKSYIYVKYGGVPSPQDYDYKTKDDPIVIDPHDENYHPTGVYYIMMQGDSNLVDMFGDTVYKFRLKWYYQGELTTVDAVGPQSIVVDGYDYEYFKHFIDRTSKRDLKITLIGDSLEQIYVSLDSDNREPTQQDHLFTTEGQLATNFVGFKQIYLSWDQIEASNPACVDDGYSEDQNCILYFSVLCDQTSQCQSQIEVSYDSEFPIKIANGVQTYGTLVKDEYTYFYISVKESNIQEVFGVMTPKAGEIDLYANIIGYDEDIENWNLPTKNHHDQKSKHRLDTEIIHYEQDQIEQCIEDNREDFNNECIIIFGVYARASQSIDSPSIYSFSAFTQMQLLTESSRTSGFVKQDEYQYFSFKSSCETVDCKVTIAVTTYENLNSLQLYINRGEETLPTKFDYDLSYSLINSNLAVINPRKSSAWSADEEKIASGYFIIGVYSPNSDRSFAIEASSQALSVVELSDGVSMRHSQNFGQEAYFYFYNWAEDGTQKNIEFEVSVNTGSAYMLINTYDGQVADGDYTDHLPYWANDEETDATWHVSAISSDFPKPMVVTVDDDNYCFDCLYLIQVTGDSSIDYQIKAQTLDPELGVSNLIKIGDTKFVDLRTVGDLRLFEFVVDSEEPATITPTLLYGSVNLYISLTQDLSDALLSNDGLGPIIVDSDYMYDNDRFYLIVLCTSSSASLSLTLEQDKTIIQLVDGTPQHLHFADYHDTHKYLTFPMQSGRQSFAINIKSNTRDFFPTLYFDVYNSSTNLNNFPPIEGSVVQAYDYTYYDSNLLIMQVSGMRDFKQTGSGLMLTLKYDHCNQKLWNCHSESAQNNWQLENDTSGDVTITVSNSIITYLAQDSLYQSELGNGVYDFDIFEVDIPAGQQLEIYFARCVGQTNFRVVKDVRMLNQTIEIYKEDRYGYIYAQSYDLEGTAYIIVEDESQQNTRSNRKNETGEVESYLIKVDYTAQEYIDSREYYEAGNDGFIDYKLKKHRGAKANLRWSNIVKYDNYDSEESEDVTDARYFVVSSSNRNADLTSVCTISMDQNIMTHDGLSALSSTFNATQIFNNRYEVKIDPGHETFFNVFAVYGDEEQIMTNKAIMIPYQPISIYVPARDATGGMRFLRFIAVLVVVFVLYMAGSACYQQRLANNLDEEMKRVVNTGKEIQKYSRVDSFASVDNIDSTQQVQENDDVNTSL